MCINTWIPGKSLNKGTVRPLSPIYSSMYPFHHYQGSIFTQISPKHAVISRIIIAIIRIRA